LFDVRWLENYIYKGNPSAIHKWWAQRPLAAARAVLFASLVDDPDSSDALPAFVDACQQLPKGANANIEDTPRMRLFDFIERLVVWETLIDDDVLEQARILIRLSTEDHLPPFLDLFAGGGTIPLEAQRLGLVTYASDLNPVAVMINKALIELPQHCVNFPPINQEARNQMASSEGWKGMAGLASDVNYYGKWIRDQAWAQLRDIYPTKNNDQVISWLWARTITCSNPACRAQIPLIGSFQLSNRVGRKVRLNPIIDEKNKTVKFEVETTDTKAGNPPKIGRGAKFRCLVCSEIATEQHVREEASSGRMVVKLMATVTDSSQGRKYHSPDFL
jgi:putative DNA methylase